MKTILALDLGTGSARAAVVDVRGRVQNVQAVPLETLYPRHGWVEQRPNDWWKAIKSSVSQLLRDPQTDKSAISAVCCCGHMHAAVPVDLEGQPIFESIALWNDKRSQRHVSDFVNSSGASRLQNIACNPPTSAWPAFKLFWYQKNFPKQMERAAQFLLPKDYINLQLTGESAVDRTEAGSSFLYDVRAEDWSRDLFDAFDIGPMNPARLRLPHDILGRVTNSASEALGIPAGLPVIVGAGDYPAALLGSGVTEPGQTSDITGTSFLLTTMVRMPVSSPTLMNVADAGNMWGTFAVVDAAGDSVRWARRLMNDVDSSYAEILSAASAVPSGSDGLIYLPYLTGERLGEGIQLRAQILNLTAGHTSAHLHRAVMEGVAMAMRHNATDLFDQHLVAEEIVCSGGGSRAKLWNEIKATVFGRSIKPTVEPEAGLIGGTCLAVAALENVKSPYSVASDLVSYASSIDPITKATTVYEDRYAEFREARASQLHQRGHNLTENTL